MNKFFDLKGNGTNVRTEIIAGITTFFTMAYIIFVNSNILGITGMDKGAVMVATILAAAIATLIMGLLANVPFALAPGMGMNAFFTFTVCLVLKFTWQQALAMVFICGIINIIITVTKIRKMLIHAIPVSLQYAISGGIGLFIAYIGFMDAKFLKFTVDVPEGAKISLTSTGSIPGLVNFTDKFAQVALIGLIITVVLMLLKVKGSILLGIIATTIVGIPFGVTDLSQISSFKFSIPSLAPTFLQLNFGGLFEDPAKIFLVITTVFAFSLSDTFDTIGTFIGTGKKTGIFDKKDEEALETGSGFSSKMDKALFADATATSIGALLGTSNTTTYIESAAGISEGGKTGLTSVVTAVMFLLALIVTPIAGIVPGAATAPALIVVGILMMSSLKNIEWDNFETALSAFFAVAIMPFTYSIANGVAAGFIFYVAAKMIRGKFKEVHPILYIVSALFIANFILMALNKL